MAKTREEIGAFAGPIYDALKDGKKLSKADLKKASKLSDEDLSLGLGWLFCEDKIYEETETIKKKTVDVIGWK